MFVADDCAVESPGVIGPRGLAGTMLAIKVRDSVFLFCFMFFILCYDDLDDCVKMHVYLDGNQILIRACCVCVLLSLLVVIVAFSPESHCLNHSHCRQQVQLLSKVHP